MNDLAQLKNQCDTLANANKLSSLSENQFNILISGESPVGIERLARMVNAAIEGKPQALEMFSAWHYACRVTDAFIANDLTNVNKAAVKRMVETKGRSAVANNIRGMAERDDGCKRELQKWLNESNGELGDAPASAPAASNAPASPARIAGQQSTSVERPTYSSVPPPRGVQTAPIRLDAPSQGQNPARHAGNVHQMRPSPQPTRDDDRTRYAPREVENHHPPIQSSEQRSYDQHNCFGKDVAVQFQNLPARPEREGAPPPYNTVMLKIAKAKGASCLSGVDWDNAILINLEPHEVQCCLAVLMGFGTKIRYAGHGRNNDKWFELEETIGDWKGSIRLNVGQGNEKRGINIGPTDVGEVMSLFQRALITQQRVSESLMMLNVKRAYGLHRDTEEAKESRKNGGGQRPSNQGGQQRYAAR